MKHVPLFLCCGYRLRKGFDEISDFSCFQVKKVYFWGGMAAVSGSGEWLVVSGEWGND